METIEDTAVVVEATETGEDAGTEQTVRFSKPLDTKFFPAQGCLRSVLS